MQDISNTEVREYIFSYIDEEWFSVYACSVVEASLKARQYAIVDRKRDIRIVDIKWDYLDNMGWIGV